MTLTGLSKVLGYGVSALALVVGALVMSGRLMPPAAPSGVRYTFGAVLMIYGVYRFLLVRMARPRGTEPRPRHMRRPE